MCFYQKYFPIITLFYLFSFFTSSGQVLINLDTAFTLLDKNNLDVQKMKYRIQMVMQDNKDAKNAFLPKINAGLSQNNNFGLSFDQVAGQLITGNKWTNSANANLTFQTIIFQGFALKNQLNKSHLEIESSQLEITSLKRTLKLQLLRIYFTAITNKALYTSILNQIKYSKELLLLQREQFNVGTKTSLDVSLAESQVAATILF